MTSLNSMDPKERQISKRLEDLPFEHLFKKEFVEHLIKEHLNSNHQLNKLIGTLEETLKTDEEYFWKDVCRSNLLTFLYIQSKTIQQLKKAGELNDKCLSQEPTNINGLACKVVLLKGNNKFQDSNNMLGELEAKESEMLSIVAKAEIAYCLQYLGPTYYRTSIQKYEEALAEHEKCKDELVIWNNNKLVMWKFHLAQTYSRLLNKGNLEEKLLNLGGNIPETMSKIFALLKEVIESNHQDYLGKAYIEMADAVKKYETSAVEGTLLTFQDHLKSDEYIKRAFDAAPEDVYVLERSGRHFRQRATKAKEFKYAIKILQKALDICPSRHVACHHIALAYKSLWLLDEHHRETRLFTNMARKGKKKSVISSQVKRMTVAAASGSQNNNGAQSATDIVLATHKNLQKQENNTNKNVPRGHPTIPSRTHKPGHILPQLRKKPDSFDVLRASNPRCKEKTPVNLNLLEAVKHMKNAVQYCPTSSRYHIDLGRLYISLGDTDEARMSFQNAKLRENFMDDNDAAYLYEQEGILEQELKADDEDIKVLYRKAIMHAVKAKVRSKMAFYNLRDILFRQKDEGRANDKIELELSLLYTTMEQYSKSKQCLQECLKNDPSNVTIMWKLIRTMYLDKTESSAADAFRYLTILALSGKLDLNNESDQEDCVDDDTSSRRIIIVDLMKIVMANEPQASKNAFNWLIESKAKKDILSADITDAVEISDVCILMSYESRFARPIVDVLRDTCNIDVKCSSEDIPFGKETRQEMIKLVDGSKAVIIVVDEEGQDWQNILLITNDHLVGNKYNFCLVFEHDSDSQRTTCGINFVDKWPRLTLNNELPNAMLIYELYKMMLGTSPI